MQIKTNASSQAGQPVSTETTGTTGLQTILQCGNINETQLQRLEPVGSGNGGHVYRCHNITRRYFFNPFLFIQFK